MAITLDGVNSLIVLDTDTSFSWQSIYDTCVAWAALESNMKYLIPATSVGKAALGGGIFTDLIFILQNGWKLKPSGYAADTQLTLLGTGITSDNSAYTVPPTSGSPVTWLMQATTAATIITVSTGSGLSTAEHDALMAVPAATENAVQVRIELATELTQIAEIHRLDGLDAANPLVVKVDNTRRTAGAIDQTITTDATNTTVQRV